MKKLSPDQRQKQLKRLAALRESDIDTSDIPELTVEQLRRAIRGLMYRPIKTPVTMRLDADIVAWLKQGGRGYQTKANALLRREMLRAMEQQKRPSAATKGRRTLLSRKAVS